MGWLAGNNWLWLLLAAVLGALVTLFLTLRKATEVTETVESVAKPTGTADGSVSGAGVGAVGAGAVGAGAVGAGALASDRPDTPEALTAQEAGWAPAADVAAEPESLAAEEAGWAPEPEPALEPEAPSAGDGAGPGAVGAGAAGAGAVGLGAVGVGALASDRSEAGEPERSFAPPSEPAVEEPPAVAPETQQLSSDEAGWAPVSEPEAAGWAPADDEPVAEDLAVAEPAVEVPEAAETGYQGSHAAPVGDPLSDPLSGPVDEAAGPEVDGEPALFANPTPAPADTVSDAVADAGAGAAVAAGAYGAGSADPLADGGAPSGAYTVKGNADSMKFHTSESPYFGRTKAEVWFDSEESARGAGFHRWDEKGADAAPATLAAVPEGAFGKGSADPLADGASPGDAFTVKGNADSMKFHTSESPYFGRTKAEVWFDSEESARGAGFHRWDEKVVAAVATIPDGAYGPGSADPGENGDAPSAAYTVKGNADSMLFHDTDSPYYSRTKAEVWFDSSETARRAGFAAWNDK
jgi:hypothetical protein